MSTFLTVLTVFALTASGIVGGVFFIFSTTITPVLATRPAGESVALMNRINDVIVRTSFIAIFVSNALASLVLIGVGIYDPGLPGASFSIAGAAVYLVGSFAVTMFLNVPRNNALAAVSTDDQSGGEAVWNRYLREWTRWNHVRTVACILSTVMLAASLLYR